MSKRVSVNEIIPLNCNSQNFSDAVQYKSNNIFIDRYKPYIYLTEDSYNFKTIKTYRKYTSVTYDSKEGCFWAIANDSLKFIYKLSFNFKELAYIEITHNLKSIAYNIAYSYESDTIIVATSISVIEIDKYGSFIKCINKNDEKIPYSLYIENRDIYGLVISENKRYIALLSKKYLLYEMPECFIPISIIDINKCEDNKYVTTKILVKNKFSNSVYILIIEIEVECECENEVGDILLCEDETKEKILNSVALIEASISHILNAEGEKLQKGICNARNVQELIKLNNSVSDTISDITHLECFLIDKLKIAMKMKK